MGLKAGSSVPDGGCSFTAIDFGAVVWKFMLVTGTGADDSMEMITTSTSGRDGGESRAKWKRTRRLCPSNTVTGNKLLGLMDSNGTKTSVRVTSAAGVSV